MTLEHIWQLKTMTKKKKSIDFLFGPLERLFPLILKFSMKINKLAPIFVDLSSAMTESTKFNKI